MTKERRESMIRGLGVFELRSLARAVGVVSPTTKKREELISLILEKMNSGAVLEEHTEKQKGRPYKKVSSIDEILNLISAETSTRDYKAPITFESVISFAQEMPVFELSNNGGTETIEGYIRKSGYDYIFYGYNKWVTIENVLPGYEKLTMGDKVKVIADCTVNKSRYRAKKILAINDVPFEQYKPQRQDLGEEIILNETIPFGKSSILLGRRNAFMQANDLYETNDFRLLSQTCQKDEIELLLLGLNTSFENQIYIKNLKLHNFTTAYGESNENNLNVVIDCVNYAQNLIRRGKKILIFIIDIVEVQRAVDICFGDEDSESSAEETNVLIKKLISLGRAFSKGSSSTLVIGYNEIDSDAPLIKHEVLKISKRI